MWSARDADGSFTCRRQTDGSWPLACRELNLIESQEVVGLAGMALALRDRFGIDVTPFYDRYHRAGLLEGVLATPGAGRVRAGRQPGGRRRRALYALRRRLPLLTPLIHVSLTLMRMTPPLLQLYLVFFGVGGLIALHGLTLSAFWTAVLVLSFYAGAANAVALAEAGRHDPAAAGRPALKQVLRLAHPAVMGSSINIVKATAMASAIAVPELVHASTAIAADYGNGAVMMNILLVSYVAIVLAVAHLFTLFEQRVLGR